MSAIERAGALALAGAVAGAAAGATPARAQERPLALGDYYRIEDAGSPALSPDGRRVAYVRRYVIEDENRENREIWLVDADGSDDPVRLTHPSHASSSPRWSPDGRLMAFSSPRPLPGKDGTAHESVWFLRMDGAGGEAFRIRGVEGTPHFSPDGARIAYTKETPPPGPAPEPTYPSETVRELEERFDGRTYDWMNYRFDRRGYLPDPRDPRATPPEELHVVPADGGEPRRLTDLGFDVDDPVWRPDGGALAFVADSHQRDEHSYGRADLWTVDLEGRVTRLTDDSFDYADPAWSPDGHSIVVRGNQGLDVVIEEAWDHGAPEDLWLFSADGSDRTNLTPEWDLEAGSPVWGPEGRWIYFAAGVTGSEHLFRVPTGGGTVEQVTTGDRELDDFSFSRDGRTVAYTAADPTRPGDVYAARLDGGDERRLTRVNRELLSEVELRPAERILFESRDGTEIEGWVMTPPGYDPAAGPYSLILNIHGGPHGAYGNDFSFAFQYQAARGYIVVYTNPRGSTGYGEAFKWGVWGQWGGVDYEDVMAGVDHVAANWPVDEGRMGVTGYSYGGFMTNWIIAHSDRFAAAVSGAGISNWFSDYGTADIPRTKESEFFGPPWEEEGRRNLIRWSPLTHAEGVSTPTLFVHGESDLRVPITENEQMYVALRKQEVPARFIRYPGEYHGGWTPWHRLHRHYHTVAWMDRWLNGGPATSEP